MRLQEHFPTKLSILQRLRTCPPGTRIRLEGFLPHATPYVLIVWGQAPHTAVLGTGEITHITQDEVLSVLWKYRSVLASPAVWLPPLPFPEGRFQPYRARGGACLASSLQQAQELIGPDAAQLRCPSQDVFFRDSHDTLTSLLREGLRGEGVQVWRTKTQGETSPQQSS